MMSRQLALEQALHCAKCRTTATFVEEHCGADFSTGEVMLITCPNKNSCKERPWFYCRSCQVKAYQNGLNRHASTKRHIEQHARAYPEPPAVPPPAAPSPAAASGALPANEIDSFAFLSPTVDDDLDMDHMGTDELRLAVEADLESTHIENGETPMDVSTTNYSAPPTSSFPNINYEGNEWLRELLKHKKRATVQELFKAFGRPEVQHMKNFWLADLASGEGRCGGGFVYLAARAFQQKKDAQLDRNLYPNYDEAKWQFNNLIQYQSMNEKQRLRQSCLNKELMHYFPSDLFFKHTFLPTYNQLGRFYGSTGIHSMWNNLPTPKAVDVDGVAYISPRAAVAYVMANGIPVDNIYVTKDYPVYDREGDQMRRVHNVDECQKAVDWFRSIQSSYYNSENGAQILNSNSGAPKHDIVVCLYLSDWTDGFDSAKVKSNRNAIDSKTFTISPPKCQINATDNTFAVALGLKKAKGWTKVEQMFREEIDELTSSSEPILFYNGCLQKMVPCFLKQFAVLSDKAERNGLTATLGCGSDSHRCFGISGKIQTPSCKVKELESFFNKEQRGQTNSDYGWSGNFVSVQGNPNGATFPSCPNCRQAVVFKLLGMAENVPSCGQCRNWDLLNPENGDGLDFPAHKDYPKSISEGSPVPPPKGRDLFEEGRALPFIPITWDLMKDACKFAFYQASRPKHAWTKAVTTCYLKHCGVSNHFADLLYTAARASCKMKEQDSVNYNCRKGIGSFQFHPAWLSQAVSLHDFIEAVMHQLFLGAAESNYELIGMWLSSTPSAAKLTFSGFLQALQVLLKDLRGFNLSWLLAYPLTGKKGKLGTGSWVAENWVCFVRLSQFVFGWCCRDKDLASKYGVHDVSRMVIAFHAFVARCLSHSGIDGQSIDETELYLKEFLSALRELDIRVRYNKLNKATMKVSERKGTEAWWLKPNYMSLGNLLSMMRVLGPLVLWWDGGGKGERFIQVVKPHIKKGVRDDATSFFVNLLEKLYRARQLEQFEKTFSLEGKTELNKEEEAVFEIINELAEALIPEEDEEEVAESDNEDSECNDSEDEAPQVRFDETYFSTNQVHGMTKSKTIFVYRNENQLNESINALKPIAGVVEVSSLEEDETAFEFFAVYRKPVKQFARRKVAFDDTKGLSFNGMWCANIEVEEEESCTSDFKEIQAAAKLAAVAIPLWYIIGKNKSDSEKYCVITNWWKYRMIDGTYRLPFLDPELYGTNIDLESLLARATREGSEDDNHSQQYGEL